MEEQQVNLFFKATLSVCFLLCVAILFFVLGIWSAQDAQASEKSKQPRVVYPKHSEFDFEGMRLQGELRNPGEFYFKTRPEEKFDSLVKRRKNFHKEMLRDAVMSR